MLEITDQNFEEVVKNNEKPVLVDFWASWCSPCTILTPILERLSEEFEGKIVFAKANVDAAPVLAQGFKIEVIPTVILFKDGQPQSKFMGIKDEPEIRTWLEKNLQI